MEDRLKKLWWASKRTDCKLFIRYCPDCSRTKSNYEKLSHRPIIPEHKRHRVQFDFFQVADHQRDPNTRDRYVLVVLDTFTKRIWLKSFPTKEASNVANFLASIFGEQEVTICSRRS